MKGEEKHYRGGRGGDVEDAEKRPFKWVRALIAAKWIRRDLRGGVFGHSDV